METNNEFLNQDALDKIVMFNYDYFFHYLLVNNDVVRLFFCQYISQDDSITYTTIENSETFHPHYQGKKLILDVVCKDNKGRYYDFEMQNGDIDIEDQIRMMRYSERLVTKQERKGVQLKNMKTVFQLIIYTGKSIPRFKKYRHDIRKADEQRNQRFLGDKVKTVLLQLRKMEEEYDMELPLQPMEQLGYLFLNNKVHENSEGDEIIKEVKDMHDKYMDSDAYFEAYTYELEQALIEQKIESAELRGKRKTIIKLLKKRINLLSEETIEKINTANNEQLDKLSDCIFDINSEEDVLHIMINE